MGITKYESPFPEFHSPGSLSALVLFTLAESLAFRAEIAVPALMVFANSVTIAFRAEIAVSTLVVFAFSVLAVGAEVAFASHDPLITYSHHREQRDTGKNGYHNY